MVAALMQVVGVNHVVVVLPAPQIEELLPHPGGQSDGGPVMVEALRPGLPPILWSYRPTPAGCAWRPNTRDC